MTSANYSDITGRVIGHWSGGGGGGSLPLIIAGPLHVAFDTASLAEGVPIPGYTPKAGDILIAQVFSITTLFTGTTPQADIFIGSTATVGLVAAIQSSTVLLQGQTNTTASGLNGAYIPNQYSLFTIVESDQDALYLVASQDGTKGGTPIDSSAGEMDVFIVALRP